MAQPDENVLVVKRSLFDELAIFMGSTLSRKSAGCFSSRGSNFSPRAQASRIQRTNRSFRMIIAHESGAPLRSREESGRAAGLKGSIGIGGHMNDTDESLFAWDKDAYRAGVEREVNGIRLIHRLKIGSALLNDDTTEVGQVHLDRAFSPADEGAKREAMITNLTF
jgi:predicted NUDIX family phosphoesterase